MLNATKKYQLVLQFDAGSMNDFDSLVGFESELDKHLEGLAEVDGHDFGSEEFNIFLLTDEPHRTFESSYRFLTAKGIPNYMRAGYREIEGEKYVVLWPHDLKDFSVS
jgi:hypothetical protein